MSDLSLNPLRNYRPFPGPVVCVIMDGVGHGAKDATDGVYLAHTPVLDALLASELVTKLKAHGTAVGMPSDADMGNSEVGHNTLGAGRVFDQGAKLVGAAVASGSVYEGEAWKRVIEQGNSGGAVHFLGLLSDGNVHSHIDHLLAFLGRCAEEGVNKVRVHTLLDGRDVKERSALGYLDTLEAKLSEIREGGSDYRIASGGGRMITTMDRYNADWSIVERGWKAHVLGDARAFPTAAEAVQTYYDEDPKVTDQYLGSFVIEENGKAVGLVEDGDAVVLMNFRGDRALEISTAFEAETFSRFDRLRKPDVFFAGMMQYDGDTKTPAHYLVNPPAVEGSMSEYLCAQGVTAFAVSETQKFGHVTYFWNGNRSGYVDESLENYVEVSSDNVPFDQRPWMKAAEITDETIAAIEEGRHKFIRLNYPNGDMVGHTGNPAAIRVSVEAVDLSLARLLPAIEKAGGVAVVLADHGNAELMFVEKDGVREPMVAHTLNPVPLIVRDFSGTDQFCLRSGAVSETPGLSNVTATIINLLGFEAPAEYDASLIEPRI